MPSRAGGASSVTRSSRLARAKASTAGSFHSRSRFSCSSGGHGVFGLVGERRALAGVVVAREQEHAAVSRGAGGVGVLEHVAATVDAGSLAVPHGEDAGVLGA